MKKIAALMVLTGSAMLAQDPPPPLVPPVDPVDPPAPAPIVIQAGHTMQGIPLPTLLEEYGALVGKTLIPAQNTSRKSKSQIQKIGIVISEVPPV